MRVITNLSVNGKIVASLCENLMLDREDPSSDSE